MKKNITIPNVDTDLYEAVKERCKQDGTSISAYFNSLLAGEAPTADESEKIKELTAQIVQLKTTLTKTERELAQANNEFNSLQKGYNEQEDVCKEYDEENEQLRKENIELKQNQTAKDAELERVKQELEETHQQNESLRTLSTNSVTVQLSPLEYALIKHVAKKESTKYKKDITPALLLKTMFSEYCIHGETWFFDFPKRSEIKALQKQIEENNDTQEETTDENE